MSDEEIIAALRSEKGRLTPVELAEMLGRLTVAVSLIGRYLLTSSVHFQRYHRTC
jgi:hypothetical protein